MEKFTIGLIIGGIGGALLTANNYKMRTLVKKSQQEIQGKLDDLMDEKIREMEIEEEEDEPTAKKKPKKATAK